MPFIEVKTNAQITDKTALKSALGQAIVLIPGKSEAYLMVEISDSLDMWFKGSDEPCAMFEVAIFGGASDNAYEKLTKKICTLSQEYLGVSPSRTYVKYTEISKWGYNNYNF